jgi:hypothetical protein
MENMMAQRQWQFWRLWDETNLSILRGGTQFMNLKLLFPRSGSMRGLKPDETVPAIADGFIARPPSVHEFVLVGLVFVGELANFPAENTVSLGKPEPLATKLRENELLAKQMISLSKLNSGAWDPGKYPSFSNNPNNSIGDSYIFDFIQAHVGTDKPSPEFEAYFRKFTIDPEQIQGGQRLYFTVEAATLLARHTPEPLHTRIFVHAVQDSLVASVRSSRSGDSGGGFFSRKPTVCRRGTNALLAWIEDPR